MLKECFKYILVFHVYDDEISNNLYKHVSCLIEVDIGIDIVNATDIYNECELP